MDDDIDINDCLTKIEKFKIPAAAGQNDLSSTAKLADRPSYSIDPSCDIRGMNRMMFGRNVVVQKECWLNIAFNNPHAGPMIIIEEGSNIGRRCTISAANKIHIGKNVLFAPNVFVADTHHEYQKLGIPIMHQGITTHSDQIYIGDESWIGINAVIMGNVTIGRHCVVGANSVVTKDIPDNCVAAGNPARVVKMYDMRTNNWIRIRITTKMGKYRDGL
jgi:acetyltransferase-like isoleucine patch superfamily enzyme